MAEFITDDKPLPLFRKDLELYDGPEESDGSPTFNLYDPAIAKYYKINWAESLVIECHKPGMTLVELTEEINTRTTLNVTKEEVKLFFIDAFGHDLLAVMKAPDYYYEVYKNKNYNVFKWLLFNYLYIRIPLFNPDKFLGQTIKYVRPLASKLAFIIYITLSLIGVTLLFTRFGEFINTFTYFFNFQGIVFYAVTISCIKVIHELAHAYTAKNYDVYVPSMGVALIVLWPVLYTDVTDSWKLKKRGERLIISSSGIISELIIAGLASICWYYSPEGFLKSIFFVISSITWVSTLLINLNPAIKFDGYYILSDLWGIDNLQTRAFAVTTWKIRSALLGLKTPCPEQRLSKKRMWGMVVYSIYTWIYRIFLYTAIALFVYFQFTKALGVLLFFMEIVIFIIWPLVNEINAISQMRSQLKLNPRMMLTLTVVFLFLGWFVLPLPHTETFSGVSNPIEKQVIYVPSDSIIKSVDVERGDWVVKGQPIVQLVSPSIETSVKLLEFEKDIIEKQIYLLGFFDQDRPYIPEKRAELQSNSEKFYGLMSKRDELNIRATINGEVYMLDDYLHSGMAISQDTVIGKIADPSKIEVVAFIPESELNVVKVGQEAKFRVPGTNDLFSGKILNIHTLRAQTLRHFPLSSLYAGELAVTKDKDTGAMKMVDSYYIATVEIDKGEGQLRFGQTGTVEVQGPWRSKFLTLMKKILSVFWRESGV
ncbi:MAG: HlyD family efflux transporter periplasmic adaptor subunit [Chlamydiota bacterium]